MPNFPSKANMWILGKSDKKQRTFLRTSTTPVTVKVISHVTVNIVLPMIHKEWKSTIFLRPAKKSRFFACCIFVSNIYKFTLERTNEKQFLLTE